MAGRVYCPNLLRIAPPPLQVGFIAFFWFIMMLAQKKLNFNKR